MMNRILAGLAVAAVLTLAAAPAVNALPNNCTWSGGAPICGAGGPVPGSAANPLPDVAPAPDVLEPAPVEPEVVAPDVAPVPAPEVAPVPEPARPAPIVAPAPLPAC